MANNLSAAISDFQRARRRAGLEMVMARLTGKSADLLSYEDVRRKLRANKQIDRGLQDVPLDAIVGSVGRYKDFTRTFLPKDDVSEQRWANLLVVNSMGRGLPPIELYKLGDAYFVLDGNHRVSIAREQGFPTIQAYVTEVIPKVTITADISLDQLIIKAEYAEFLERTKLDDLRPEADFTLTAPGKYKLLEDHIEVHNYFMGLDFQREIDWDEAVVHWYDEVYLPVVEMIRSRGLMRELPNRTETDFYVWLAEHRAELEESLGWRMETEEAVADFAAQLMGRTEASRMAQLWETAEESDKPAPTPNSWRQQYLLKRRSDCLFGTILTAVGEDDLSEAALRVAALIAQRENGQLRGLHLVTDETDQTERLEEFDRTLHEFRVAGELAFDMGEPYRKIVDRAQWADLVVASLKHPPGEKVLARINSAWRQLLLRSPRPVLAVPAFSAMQRPLLAYDGSAKAEEALFVATYMAGRWQLPLTVVTVGKNGNAQAVLAKAQAYLEEKEVSAEFVLRTEDPAISILLTAEKQNCDLIIMGGYSSNPVLELFIGSTVDQVLRNATCPVLVISN